ncbi:MAG TPA: hypothetical protein VHC19_08670 [Pirellulales bacterium]|nr:hypothetical protein [Pirellulales bacterium]
MAWSRRDPTRAVLLAGICGLLPALTVAGAEKSYTLRSSRKTGDVTKVQVEMEVGGELKVVAEGKVKPLKMSVKGKLAYEEKLLDASSSDDGIRLRSARHYDLADADIKIEEGDGKPKLREERRLIVVDATPAQTVLFSPQGPLTREELDLVDVPANSLWIEQLLPTKPVSIGSRWTYSDSLAASLLGLDAVSQSDVSSELKTIDDKNARFEFAGKVHGAVGGVATEIEVKGKCRYDRKQRRVAWVGLLIKENRSIGHVSTGLNVVARMQVHLAPGRQSEHLPDSALQSLPTDASALPISLECRHPAGKFSFQHARGWHVMSDLSDVITMRYVDRGEVVAQCNISALADQDPGKRTALGKFQQDIERSLDKDFGQFIQASESVTSNGHVIYRVVAEGTVSELPIQWRYYLVSDDQGRQVVFAYTLEKDLAAQLGDADQELVSSLEFAARPKNQGQPTPAAMNPWPTKIGRMQNQLRVR